MNMSNTMLPHNIFPSMTSLLFSSPSTAVKCKVSLTRVTNWPKHLTKIELLLYLLCSLPFECTAVFFGLTI
jgi:hypothetical protein